ncbi:MAG TPA: MBL fold metallo-hydrolase [Ktedonobacteraceae bacterium]|nr:MBL fold metallo-hydrolase [Ktedonobacteraceae bacterium]
MQEQQGQQEPRESAETQVAQEREGVYKIILAPNPSIMTGPGTNTIVVGGAPNGSVIIDPAVDTVEYLDTVVYEGVQRGPIRCILITHGHGDHTGGAVALRERLKVPIYAFGLKGFPEADAQVSDGDTFPVGDDTLIAIHTPGHRFDHLCYMLEKHRILFAGDLVAGVGTVVIIPPEGDMQQYLDSLTRLQELDIKEIVPAHGPVITDPQAKLAEYIAHRLDRERQVLDALEALPRGSSIPNLVQYIYADVDPRLHPVAARTVEAHLLKLEREGQVERLEPDGWALTDPTA